MGASDVRNCYSALQREWIAVLDIGGGGSALVRINQRAATAGRRTSDGVAGDGGRWMDHRRMEGSLRRGATSAAVRDRQPAQRGAGVVSLDRVADHSARRLGVGAILSKKRNHFMSRRL
jgi:hypothetical protein